MRTTETSSLFIHPELIHPRHERGVFEVEGHVGGWREWLAYDSYGVIRVQVGMNDRDCDEGFVARLEAILERFEAKDREHEA